MYKKHVNSEIIMKPSARKRFMLLFLGLLAFFITSWLELYLQNKQQFVDSGVNKISLFLLININVIVIVILLYLIIRQSMKLFIERRKETPGTAFTRNLLFAFSLFSVMPTFFVFFTAGKFITTSIDVWFHTEIMSGLVAGRALHEFHSGILRQQMKEYALQFGQGLVSHKDGLYQAYVVQNADAGLDSIIDQELDYYKDMRKPVAYFRQLLKSRLQMHYYAYEPFDFFGAMYLVHQCDNGVDVIIVFRHNEPLRSQLISLDTAYYDHQELRSIKNPIYINYIATFIVVTLLILFLSIWSAFYLARGISRPIQELLDATKQIQEGDLNVYVRSHPSNDLHMLCLGFNQMTNALRAAQHQLEAKTEEMMMIFEHIKSAVILINRFGRIITCNDAARSLLEESPAIKRNSTNKFFCVDICLRNQFFGYIRELNKDSSSQLVKDITLPGATETRLFTIRFKIISINHHIEHDEKGLLIVLEDKTEIVKESRMKTWQEAAKQMAHEIKNPLTPIQLATQRLQKKYGSQLVGGVFMDSTNTILEQVGIIKNLTSHFFEFASMPALTIEEFNLNEIVKETMELYALSYPDITISFKLDVGLPLIKSDRIKLKRVITNLADNSVRALNSCSHKQIRIETLFAAQQNFISLYFTDNGPGISEGVKDRLFLPYVSTEKKNMGLGLAIVHDTMVQLGGSIELTSYSQGTTFTLKLPA